MTWTRSRLVAVAMAIALTAAACGGDDDSTEAADAPGAAEDTTEAADAPDAAEDTTEATDAPDAAEDTTAGGVEVSCEGPLAELVTIRMGDIQSASQAGQYLAMDLGYFEDLNIQPELVPVQGAGAQIALFATGDLDIATGTPTAGFFNAIAGDIGLRFIGTWVTQEPGDATQALVARSDLFDSGEITATADLVGHTIAQPGSVDDTFSINTYLEAAGIGLDDVRLESLAYPDILAALGSRAGDPAILIEPIVGFAETQGVAAKLVPQGDVLQGPVTFIVAGAGILDGDPQIGACFMEALLKGQSAYMDAFFGSGEGMDEAIDILTQRTRLTDPADWPRLLERQGLPKVALDGAMSPSDLDRFQEYYVADGTLAQYLPPEETTDLRFVPTSSG